MLELFVADSKSIVPNLVSNPSKRSKKIKFKLKFKGTIKKNLFNPSELKINHLVRRLCIILEKILIAR